MHTAAAPFSVYPVRTADTSRSNSGYPAAPLAAGLLPRERSSTGNYQFLHTINDAVYVYVFGDRVGSLVVGGIAFGVPCGGGNGITEVILRYNQHRIAATGNPVIVGFADLAFPCFLTGFNVDTADPETHTAQWALRFNFFPQS